MMNSHALTAKQAKKYHEHDRAYYTKNLTNRDRWHGALAKSLGLEGELHKDVFDYLCDEIEASGRKNVAYDKTLSAPKSMSLAMAFDKRTREDMIAAHQEATEFVSNYIEMRLLNTRSHGKRYKSRNCICAEFTHFLSRPSEDNNFEPDLDLHSHLLFLNKTYFDGSYLAQDWKDVLNKRMFKRLGVMFRSKLAECVQARGYETEISDAKNGFFELSGFPREIIEQYSHREHEVLKYAKEHDVDIETAKTQSRHGKEVATIDADEVMKITHRDLFASGKINIKRSFL